MRARFSASSSASITDANIIGEGRLPGPGQGSWLATARRTYYDLVAERFIDQDLPSFNDAQIKTAWQLPGGRRLSLLGLRSRELTSIKPDDDTDGRAEIRSRNDLVSATAGFSSGARVVNQHRRLVPEHRSHRYPGRTWRPPRRPARTGPVHASAFD